jgi:hypothetical protein
MAPRRGPGGWNVAPSLLTTLHSPLLHSPLCCVNHTCEGFGCCSLENNPRPFCPQRTAAAGEQPHTQAPHSCSRPVPPHPHTASIQPQNSSMQQACHCSSLASTSGRGVEPVAPRFLQKLHGLPAQRPGAVCNSSSSATVARRDSVVGQGLDAQPDWHVWPGVCLNCLCLPQLVQQL